MIKIGIMGHGTVGSGVVSLLDENKSIISKTLNKEVEVKRILEVKDFSNLEYSEKFTKDLNDIKKDDEIKIVVETIGGATKAYEYTKELLKSKKSVITSNKELVAKKGHELIKLAKENGVNYLFEASVGGGMPIIMPINRMLSANKIIEVVGILNGTTNFILSSMENSGLDFNKALKIAQQKGYAELNPAADIEGVDSLRKICIISNMITKKQMDSNQVYKEGIEGIQKEDFDNLNNINSTIKLISYLKFTKDDKIKIMVSPFVINKDDILANVNDVYSGCEIKGNYSHKIFLRGEGAGKEATASAVMSDIMECVLLEDKFITPFWSEIKEDRVISYKEYKFKYYLRVKINKKSDLNIIKDKFKYIEVIKNSKDNKKLAFITKKMKESKVDKLIEELEEKNIKKLSKLRVLN